MARTLPPRQHAVNHVTSPARRTPAGDAVSVLAVRVLRLAGLLTATGDALARPAGQTSARWQVLAAAEHAPATVADVARALGLARQSVQRVADLLVGDGLAEYRENPAHRRAKRLALTPAGRRALAGIQAAQRGWADALGARLDAADLRRAAEVLGRVSEAVTAGAGLDEPSAEGSVHGSSPEAP